MISDYRALRGAALFIAALGIGSATAGEDAAWVGADGRNIARLVRVGPPDPALAATGAAPPSAFIHPLLNPAGAPLTELYPVDHLHHRGIFWAWHQIWRDARRVGDGWLLTGVRFRPGPIVVDPVSGVASLTTEWMDDKEAILKEAATVVARDAGIEIKVTLTPLVDGISIGGSEDDKGYGGLSFRLRGGPAMRFESEGTAVEARRQAVAAGPEMRFTWDDAPGAVSIACTVNGAPIRQWILRREASMQNCVWPGAAAVSLPRGKPVILTARIDVGS